MPIATMTFAGIVNASRSVSVGVASCALYLLKKDVL
jgi:hypothetical protein